MLQNHLKKAPRGVRRRFERVSKKDLNKEGSEDRFSLHFWMMLGAPGEAKMWSIPRTLSKFWVLAHLKIRWVLEREKCGFWVDFGNQVGKQNRNKTRQDIVDKARQDKTRQRQDKTRFWYRQSGFGLFVPQGGRGSPHF